MDIPPNSIGRENSPRPLWAPWRIEYIRSQKSLECFICDYVGKPSCDQQNHVIMRGTCAFVFLNRFPYNSGHMLIAPYRHIAALNLLSDSEAVEIYRLIVRAQAVAQQCMSPDGWNMGCNLGTIAGGAIADHLHLHLVPRWNGDTNFMPVCNDTKSIPEALDATMDLLQRFWHHS